MAKVIIFSFDYIHICTIICFLRVVIVTLKISISCGTPLSVFFSSCEVCVKFDVLQDRL